MIKSHKKTIYESLARGPVHPFPARMSPGIALELVGREEQPLRVLDPMMGSGTVLAIARTKGHYAIGVDIDPLAVLIAKTWTTAIDTEKLVESSERVLHKAKAHSGDLALRDAYPRNANQETKRFIRYWFDPQARRQLTSLGKAIAATRDRDIRDALWCAFSRLIITKQSGASRAMDLSHSRPHRVFDTAPTQPFSKFLSAAKTVASNCVSTKSRQRGPAPRIICGDARKIPIPDESIDLVLTSPPYLNAIDYIRCSKFSLVWMGHSISSMRDLRSASVGSEVGQPKSDDESHIENVIRGLRLNPKLSDRNEAILRRFVRDMHAAVGEVSRVLRPGGKAIYVVGENTVRGTYIRNAGIVSAVAELAGLSLTDRRSRILPANRRYLPPPEKRDGNATLNARMRREVLLEFTL